MDDNRTEDEKVRRHLSNTINAKALDRPALEREHGQVWNTDELLESFRVLSFLAPFVYVIRKSDNQMGALAFQHHPRFYFGRTSLDESLDE